MKGGSSLNRAWIAVLAAALALGLSACGDDEPEPAAPAPEPDVVADCDSKYQTVGDLSVRNMECDEAEPLVLDAIQELVPEFSVGEFECTILGDYGPRDGGPILGAENVRCIAGERAFRFSFAD